MLARRAALLPKNARGVSSALRVGSVWPYPAHLPAATQTLFGVAGACVIKPVALQRQLTCKRGRWVSRAFGFERRYGFDCGAAIATAIPIGSIATPPHANRTRSQPHAQLNVLSSLVPPAQSSASAFSWEYVSVLNCILLFFPDGGVHQALPSHSIAQPSVLRRQQQAQ